MLNKTKAFTAFSALRSFALSFLVVASSSCSVVMNNKLEDALFVSSDGASSLVGIPASIVVVSGDAQTGLPSTQLTSSIVVRVIDFASTPVANTSVSFVVTGGGGSLSFATVVTDVSGLASVDWTLGAAIGAQSMLSFIAGIANVAVNASAASGTPVNLLKISGDAQSGTVGQQLAAPLVIQVTDGSANPVQGVTVNFTVTAGGGSRSVASAVTDASGNAQVDWTLGTVAGAAQTLQVSSTGLASVNFSATATVGAATTLSKNSGDAQSAEIAQQLTNPIEAKVVDTYGNPVSGVTVNFAVTAGGGSLGAASAVTDASGLASVTWTLGMTAGAAQTAQASSAGLTSVNFSATSTAGSPNKLFIATQPSGTGTAGAALAQQAVVEIRDVADNAVTTSTLTVTLTAYTDSGCTTTTGAGTNAGNTKAAVAGISTFTAYSYTKAETIYLRASSGALSTDCSAAVAISAGALSTVTSTVGVAAAVADNSTKSTVTVTFYDAYSNPISGQTPTMRIEMGTGTYTITDACTSSNASGVSTCKFTTFRPGKQIVHVTAPIDINSGVVNIPCVTSGGTAPNYTSPFMSGTGLVGDPYIITDHPSLEQLRCFNGATFKIAPATVIDLTGVSWLPILKFDTSVATNIISDANFASSLDGQGSEIKNLTIDSTGQLYDSVSNYSNGLSRCVAFIGETYHGAGGARVIQNVNFRDPTVTGTGNAGIVSCLTGFQYDNIHIMGATGGTLNAAAYVGGIVGRLQGDWTTATASVTNSSFSGVITYVNGAGGGGVGGIVGVAAMEGVVIDDNSFTGTIQLPASPSARYYGGGILGKFDSITNAKNPSVTPSVSRNSVLSSTISLQGYVGGVVGQINYNQTIVNTPTLVNIDDNYVSSTTVACTSQACGGIIGRVTSAGNLTGYSLKIRSNAVSSTAVSAASNIVGGIVAYLSVGEVLDSYFVGGTLTAGALMKNLGGIVGQVSADATSPVLKIDSSYASTTATIPTGGGVTNYGGLVGLGLDLVTVTTPSYWNTTTLGLAVACSAAATGSDANGRITADLQGGITGTTFVGWDNTTIWTFPGAAYPKLQAPNPN